MQPDTKCLTLMRNICYLVHSQHDALLFTQVCGGCGCVRYCSVECQRRHRGSHQEFCRRMGSLTPSGKVSTTAKGDKVDEGNIPA